MSLSDLAFGLVIPLVVLVGDYGRRRLTTMRMLRPFLGAAIVIPLVLPGFDLRGGGLWLEAVAVAAGVALGVLAAWSMRVQREGDAVWTFAGRPYVVLWILVAGARLLFVYRINHSASFAKAVGMWMYNNDISKDALADSFMFVSLAMLLTLRAVLFVRSRSELPAGSAVSVEPAAV